MKNDDFNGNDFDEIEEYDSDNENYAVEELTDEEVEETIGGGLGEPEGFTSASTPIVTNRNFKYTTTEGEICLTDLTQRLGQIDKIQVINNPINAKISCNDNLVSIENQGAYGLVQMEVSGHNAGETKSARAENIFVEFDSVDGKEWIDTEDDAYYDELDDDELEETGGRSNDRHKFISKTTGRSSVTFCNSRYGKVFAYHLESGNGKVNISYSRNGRLVKISKKNKYKYRHKKIHVLVTFDISVGRKTYTYTYCVDFI